MIAVTSALCCLLCALQASALQPGRSPQTTLPTDGNALSLAAFGPRRHLAEAVFVDPRQTLDAHNFYRWGIYRVGNLTWNAQAAADAQSSIAGCAFKLTNQSDPYGENIHVSRGIVVDMNAIVAGWYSKLQYYDYAHPTLLNSTAGEATQVLWKATQSVGCAAQHCADVAGVGKNVTLVACNYSPPGNYGQTAAENVPFPVQSSARPTAAASVTQPTSQPASNSGLSLSKKSSTGRNLLGLS